MAVISNFKINLKLIGFFIVLYLYIYNPVFAIFGIGSIKIIIIFLLAYSLTNKKIVHYLTYFKVEFFFVLVLITYSTVTSVRSNDSIITLPYFFLIWFIESIYAPIALLIFFKNEFRKYNWKKLFVIIGTIASLISLFLILNNDINDFVNYTLIESSGSLYDNYHRLRGYGLADGLRGSYAMTQGIILGICMKETLKNWRYIIIILLLFISIAFNARTGIIAIPVSFLILLLSFSFNLRSIIFYAVFLLLIYSLNFSFLYSDYESFIIWFDKGYQIFIEILFGDNSSFVAQTLFVDETFLPSNTFEFFFGTGNHSDLFLRVDNGYYYLLWFGGWLMMSIVFCFIMYMFFRIYMITEDRYYTYLFFILLLLFSIKSNYLFNPSSISRIIGIYYVSIIVNHKIKSYPTN